MANGRNRGRDDPGRDKGNFIAMPHAVMVSPAYLDLSHPARSLLWEMALQFTGGNNGSLLASAAHLSARGWNSNDTITRAKRELLEAKFLYETVKGRRPNWAAWYAVTWRKLDPNPRYDEGAAAGFVRMAYRTTDVPAPLPVKPTRQELYERWRNPEKNAGPAPPHGVEGQRIAPPHGVGTLPIPPPDGAMRPDFPRSSTPPDGDLLDMPSAVRESTTATT